MTDTSRRHGMGGEIFDIPDTAPTVSAEVVEHGNGILASADLMDQVIRDVEAHSAGESVYLHHVATTLRAKAKDMIDALELHMLKVLEKNPINHAGRHYRTGRKKERERFDHDQIVSMARRLIVDQALETYAGDEALAFENGVRTGASEMARVMRDLYVSDSTTAKVGQLDRLGIPRDKDHPDTVRHWEPGPKYIDVSPIQSQAQT